MVRMRFEMNDGSPLRDNIFELLASSNTTGSEDLQALMECASHIQNTTMIRAVTKECGLSLSKCKMNNDLELYYDIKRGRHDLGYISKGWTDPGFRIGDLIELPRSKVDIFKRNAYQLLTFCATNGIVMTVKETPETIEIAMDGVIYNEGFNKTTFKKTLETLNECVEKAEALLGECG